MAYTVHQAKTHFSRLLKEAEAGKEVVSTRGRHKEEDQTAYAKGGEGAKKALTFVAVYTKKTDAHRSAAIRPFNR